MSIGSLVVRIGADISGLRRDSAKAAKSLGDLSSATKSVSTAIKALGVAWAASKLTGMAKDALQAIDAQAKLARQFGATIDGMRAMKVAAADSGVEFGVLRSGLNAMTRRLGEAARGTGPAAKELDALGLSAKELIQLKSEDAVGRIGAAIASLPTPAQRSAAAMNVFGDAGRNMVGLFDDAEGKIAAARQEIQDLGLSLSEVDAAQVEAANDALSRISMIVEGVGQRIAVQLSPYLQEAAERIASMTKEAGGFKGAIDESIRLGLRGFGAVADAVHALEIGFKGAEYAVWLIAGALADMTVGAAKAVSSMADFVIEDVNRIIEGLNRIPGVDIEPLALTRDSKFMQGLEDARDAVHATVEDVAGQLLDLSDQDWPSDKVAEFFAAVEARAKEAAQNVVAAGQQMRDAVAPGGGVQEDEEEKRLREKLEQRLQMLREFAMTEAELERERHSRRLEQLNEALNAELISLAEFGRLSESIESKHMETLARIREKGMERVEEISVGSMAAGLQQMTGMMASLTAASAQHNKEMFDAHKGFAIADALISGAAGVAQTLGAYPFPYNLAMAAPHAAAAAAQVAAISAQQFSGGGTVRAPSAGTVHSGGGIRPPPQSTGGSGGPVGPVGGGPGQVANINLHGDLFGRESVIRLAEQINEIVGDGVQIRVAR